VTIFMSGLGPLVPPRSAYLAQVRRIAPPELRDRDAELGELARFCLDERRGPYVWWRAGPWAGKSALLSTFVLDPPEVVRSRVQVVAFFITARLAAQDTRQAFTSVVTEQLAALTGEHPPTVLDESLREAWLLDLLGQAAASCRRRGVRLVLVVDGLDEDRGATTGPDAHSIAGLLPADPPAGMRVIVAGRPNPPVPDDVPDWHPLRDPGIIRLLADSPHARDLQRLGQTELKRLLKGSPIEQDLLGLLTAARGGLSGPDLHDLTGADLVHIEDVLHTVAGRTFTSRAAQWAGDSGPLVYLLGHEELDAAARRFLGEPRLAGYRDRLHTWADTYSHPADGSPPWPAGTPEYLLGGYTRLLTHTRDTARLVALVTDPARHDRMLDLTGGDTAALDEITTAQDLVLATPRPDLEAMLRLSIRRTNLTHRNTNIPTDLPAVWATLGQPDRAEALARSITDPASRTSALVEVIRAVAAAGDHDRAEALARSLNDPSWRAWALTAVAEAVAAAGDHDRARQLTATATAIAEAVAPAPIDPSPLASALAKALQEIAAAIANGHARWYAVTDEAGRPSSQAWALAEVVWAAAAGDQDPARQLAAAAEALRHTRTNPARRASALTEVAQAVAAAGDHDRARQLAVTAEALARSLTDPYARASVLTQVARAVAAAGDHDRAEALARSLSKPHSQASALAEVARAVAAAGDHDRAEAMARSITDPSLQVRALTWVAQVIAASGDHDRARQLAAIAEAVTRSTTDPSWHVSASESASAEVAPAVAAAGDHDRAEAIARSITDPSLRVRALTEVTQVIAAAGDHDRARQVAAIAEAVARAITDPSSQVRALTGVAQVAAAASDHDQARQLVTTAEAVARSISDPSWRAWALTWVAQAVAAAGDYDRAEAVARSITDPSSPAWALTEVAQLAAAAGDHDRAIRLLSAALAVESWLTPLSALAQYWPQVVLRFVDQLSGNEQRVMHTSPDQLDDPDMSEQLSVGRDAFRHAAAAFRQANHNTEHDQPDPQRPS
jgi:tetratricopeptide (TPR) repeat protein